MPKTKNNNNSEAKQKKEIYWCAHVRASDQTGWMHFSDACDRFQFNFFFSFICFGLSIQLYALVFFFSFISIGQAGVCQFNWRSVFD